MTERKSSPPRTSPPTWTKPPKPHPRKTGARPTPEEKKQEAPVYVPKGSNKNFGIVPNKLSMWGNDRFGICVSAEEWFAKACEQPEVDLSEESCIAWATPRGFRDGADLGEVMDAMLHDGPKVGSQQYNDGPHATVDWTNMDTLWSAIMEGVVKVAIDSRALPSSAGNDQGWYASGGRPNQWGNTDHCIGFSGAGDAAFLFGLIGVPVPSGFKPSGPCVLAFTWSTMGVVDFPWVMSTVAEAHLRAPTTVYVPPLTPTPPPPPPPPPGGASITLSEDMKAGTYLLGGGSPLPVDMIKELIAALQALLPPEHPAQEALAIPEAIQLTPQQWQMLLALLLQLLPFLLPTALAKLRA